MAENLTYNLNINPDMKGINQMKQEMKDLKKEMDLAAKSGDNIRFEKAAASLGMLKNDMADASKRMKALDPGEIVNGWVKFGQGAVGAFAGATGAMTLFGVENKNLQEIEKKSMALIQIMMGLESMRSIFIDQAGKAELKALFTTTAAQVKSVFMKQVAVAVTEEQVASEIELAASKGVVITATEAETAALAKMNTVAMMNPYVILAVAIAALVVGIGIYLVATHEQTQAEKDLQVAIDSTTKSREEANKNSASDTAKTKVLIEYIGLETTSRKERKKSIKELDDLMPGVLSKQDKENLLLGKTDIAERKLTESIYQKALMKAYEGRVAEAVEKQMLAIDKVRDMRAITSDPKKAYEIFKKNAGGLGLLTDAINKYLPSLGFEAALSKAAQEALTELKDTTHGVEIITTQAAQATTNFNSTIKENTDLTDKNTSAKKGNIDLDKMRIDLITDKWFKLSAQQDLDYKIERKRIKESSDTEANKIIALDLLYKKRQQQRIQNANDEYEEKRKIRLTEAEEIIAADQAEIKSQIELDKAKIEADQDWASEVEALNKQAADDNITNIERISKANQNAITQEIDMTQNLVSSLSQIMDEFSQKEISRTDNLYQKKIDAINDEGKVYTEKELRIKSLEEQRDAEIATMQKKAGNRKKALAIANITVDTAQAIMVGFGEVGPVAGAVLAALTAAMGAAEIAIVSSTEYAKGGFLQGPLHSQGGIKTPFGELEGGEFVSSRRTTTRFAPVLQAMNNAGNSNSPTQLIDYDLLASKLNDKKVVIVSSEMSARQKLDYKIEQRSKF